MKSRRLLGAIIAAALVCAGCGAASEAMTQVVLDGPHLIDGSTTTPPCSNFVVVKHTMTDGELPSDAIPDLGRIETKLLQKAQALGNRCPPHLNASKEVCVETALFLEQKEPHGYPVKVYVKLAGWSPPEVSHPDPTNSSLRVKEQMLTLVVTGEAKEMGQDRVAISSESLKTRLPSVLFELVAQLGCSPEMGCEVVVRDHLPSLRIGDADRFVSRP
ncbi:MAG: hypothetical protein U0414_17920 [Polyangiaceae bacterium]